MELLNYRANVECQISYSNKNIYFSLVENYLTEKITPDKFRAYFLDLQNQDSKAGTNILNNVEKLSTFSLAPDAIEEEDLSEAQFRDSIEQIFQQLKKYCDP